MSELILPWRNPQQALRAHGLKAKKSFGQNFLKDDSHVEAIARAAVGCVKGGDAVVLEYGAGLGALTRKLLDAGATVHAVERDRDLVPILNGAFAMEREAGRLTLHEANAASFDVLSVLGEPGPGRAVITGNLPYQLTSSLLFLALEHAEHIAGAVFMIQLEVAQRTVATPGTKAYSMLTAVLHSAFHVEAVRTVPAGAFHPVPKVESAVIRLVPLAEPIVSAADRPAYIRVVKAAFAQRRKTLRNGLKSVVPDATAVLEAAGIEPSARAETLTPADFARLTKAALAAAPDAIAPPAAQSKINKSKTNKSKASRPKAGGRAWDADDAAKPTDGATEPSTEPADA